MLTITRFLCICLSALNFVTAQYPPDSANLTVKELEHLYFDGAANGFFSAITPCSNYYDPSTGQSNSAVGRQSAAEWIRTAFHDFVTGDIYTQTGGLDASIGFETGRNENIGPAFNDALTFFSYFFNKQVSMSDLIALGTVVATAACGGPLVEFRAGRVDATQAGPSGVPRPETDLTDTLNQLSNAGFNEDDTITLTACGHTMGGVHKATFPQVIENSTGLTGTDGRAPFDETVAGFDYDTASDYVDGTGLLGGPLVTTSNVTVQSDLRLYESDKNQTITRLAASNSYFESQCQSVFQRMIETIPGGVILINPALDPTATTNLKPADIYLSVDWSGNMVLTGYFRYIQFAGAAAAPSSLTITLVGRSGQTTTTSVTATKSASDTGTGIWGPTNSYSFTLNFPATTGLSGLTVSGKTFEFQDTMFVVPSLSSVSPAPPAFAPSPSLNTVTTYSVNTTVAYLTTTPPTSLTATFAIPQPQTGTVSPIIDTSSTATLSLIGLTGPFAIYSAITSHSVSGKQAYGSSMDVAVTGQTAQVEFFKPFIAAM
ncbi:hypothetical protein MMC28_010565 [Mycoblastus sanguinarius]|nr:hypothetical protein [Mycoblastus sanguinarius]